MTPKPVPYSLVFAGNVDKVSMPRTKSCTGSMYYNVNIVSMPELK